MTEGPVPGQSETISVEEMKTYLEDEIKSVRRAADLRIKEFTEFTNAYAAGALTPEQAMAKYLRHADKWTDSFPGLMRDERYLSDVEIIEGMEKATRPYTSKVEASKRVDPASKGERSPG